MTNGDGDTGEWVGGPAESVVGQSVVDRAVGDDPDLKAKLVAAALGGVRPRVNVAGGNTPEEDKLLEDVAKGQR